MRIMALILTLMAGLFAESLDSASKPKWPRYPRKGEILVCVDNNRAVGQCHIERVRP